MSIFVKDDAQNPNETTMMRLITLQERLNTTAPQVVGLDGYPFFGDEAAPCLQREIQRRVDALHCADEPQTKWSEVYDEVWFQDLINQHGAEAVWIALVERVGWMVQHTSYRVGLHLESMLYLLMHSTLEEARATCSRETIEQTLSMLTLPQWAVQENDWRGWMAWIEQRAAASRLTPEAFVHIRTLDATKPWGVAGVEAAVLGVRLQRVIARVHMPYYTLGWPWSERMHDDLERMDSATQQAWHHLLQMLPVHALRPSKRWLKQAQRATSMIEPVMFRQHVLCWFAQVGQKPTLQLDESVSAYDVKTAHLVMGPHNEAVLRGLVFAASQLNDELVSAMIAEMAIRCYKKVTDIGPVAQRLGRSCIESLASCENPRVIGQLLRVRQSVAYAAPQKLVDAAMLTARERIGEDASGTALLPTLGVEPDGVWRARFGDWRVALELSSSWVVQTRWQRCVETTGQTQLLFLVPGQQDTAKAQKTPPKSLKTHDPTSVEVVGHQTRQMATTVDTLRDVLLCWMNEQRVWTGRQVERDVLGHPLLGPMSRALLWDVEGLGAIAWSDGRWVDRDNRPIIIKDATMRMWHPASATEAQREYWRGWVVHHEIKQPINQVFAPLYLEAQHPLSGVRGVALQQQQFQRHARLLGWHYDLQGPWPTEPAATKTVTFDARQWTVKLWLNAVQDVQLKTRQGICQWVWVDRLEVYDDLTTMTPLEHLPRILYSALLAEFDHLARVSGGERLVDRAGLDTTSSDALKRAMDAAGAPTSRGFDARVSARAQWLEMIIAKLELGAYCAVMGQTLVLAQSHPYHVNLNTGRCVTPQDDFDVHLGDRARRRAQHFMDRHIPLAFEPDPVLHVALSHLVLHVWDINQSSLPARQTSHA